MGRIGFGEILFIALVIIALFGIKRLPRDRPGPGQGYQRIQEGGARDPRRH